MTLQKINSDHALPRLSSRSWERIAPLAFGAGIIATGALLSRFRPAILDMPTATPRHREPSGRTGKAVARIRDGADHMAPDNMSAKLGKSLVLAGAAMLAARLLDEVVSD